MAHIFPINFENSKISLKKTDICEANDLVTAEGFLYGISREEDKFFICDIRGEHKDNPKELSQIFGLGNLRQIEVSSLAVEDKKIVAITARQNGLYLIDATNPYEPKLLCQYNTVEFATAVNFCGKYVFVGCRNFGVEIIDISNPEEPEHCSIISAGEVQSLLVEGGYLYTGSWGERVVNIFDVKNIMKLKQVASIPLEGRGDGLSVKNGILFAAFGHHSRPATGFDPNQEGYAMGNGFSIWDVSNPQKPKQLSTTMLPHKYYCTSFDLWDVAVSKNYAILSHTLNGVFIYDIKNLESPRLVEHIAIKSELPAEKILIINEITTKIRPMVLPFDYKKEMYAPVRGVALSDERLYIATKAAKMHIAKGEYFKAEEESFSPLSKGSENFYLSNQTGEKSDITISKTQGQCYAVIEHDDLLWVACGVEGIKVFSKDTLECLKTVSLNLFSDKTVFALDIREINGLLVIAAGPSGVLICRKKQGLGLELVGKCDVEGTYCSQAVPSDNGRFVMVQSGDSELVIIDISDPTAPKIALKDRCSPGLLYYRQISYNGIAGRYYSCCWNSNYVKWYDLGGDKPLPMDWTRLKVLGGNNGITGLEEEYKALAITCGGFVIHDAREEKTYPQSNINKVAGIAFSGKPIVKNGLLCVSERAEGTVTIIDIKEAEKPILVRRLNFLGHPDIACITDKGVVIPLGYGGLALIPKKE